MTPDLIDALGALVVQLQAWLAGGGLVLARVGPVFALAPVLGERAIPVRIRLVAALAMTAVSQIEPARLPDRKTILTTVLRWCRRQP